MATSRDAISGEVLLLDWWQEHSSLTAVLSSARVLWPIFDEWQDCVFFTPPGSAVQEWRDHLRAYAPRGWEALPLQARRAAAARIGEQSLNHLVRVQYAQEQAASENLLDCLVELVRTTWPCALSLQFPERSFSVIAAETDEGAVIRILEI